MLTELREAARVELMIDLTANWIDRDVLWEEWLHGLRRPTYQQGRVALLRDGYYCPLGVLCSVAGIRPTFPHGKDTAAQFAGRTSLLPEALAEFMNITDAGMFRHAVPAMHARKVPRVEYPAGSIVSLNDTAQWSFVQIADYLKDHRSNMRSYKEFS